MGSGRPGGFRRWEGGARAGKPEGRLQPKVPGLTLRLCRREKGAGRLQKASRMKPTPTPTRLPSELHFGLTGWSCYGWCRTAGDHLWGGEHFLSVSKEFGEMLPAVHVDFLVIITPEAWQRMMEAKDSGPEAGGTGRRCMARGQRKGHEADMGKFGAFWRGSWCILVQVTWERMDDFIRV